MYLSPHFTLEELTASSTALRLGIDNTLPLELLDNLTKTAAGLEGVRNLLGAPMHVDSGYRCPTLNQAVRGSATSAHMLGWAVDFTSLAGDPKEIVRLIVQSRLDYDQVIQEGTWVHISFAPALRRESFTAKFGVGGTTYQKGLT